MWDPGEGLLLREPSPIYGKIPGRSLSDQKKFLERRLAYRLFILRTSLISDLYHFDINLTEINILFTLIWGKYRTS